MKPKKVVSELRQEFQKQRARLLKAVRRGLNQGYLFPDNVVPSMPKRVTKQAVERIKKVKPSKLYEKSEWVDVETGEVVSGKQKREEVKRRGIEKGQETRKWNRHREQRQKLLDDLNSKEAQREYHEALREYDRGEEPEWHDPRGKKYDILWKHKSKKWVEVEEPVEEPVIESPTEEPEYDWVDEYEQDNFPTISILDTIREKIESMTPPQIYRAGTKGKVEYPIDARKNYLLQIFDDSVMYYGEDEYSTYLQSKIEEISEGIDSVSYKASSAEAVDATFAQIGVLLNARSLSAEQAESLHSMTELY